MKFTLETRKLGFYKHQYLSSQKIMSETEIGGLNTILGGKIQQTEITRKWRGSICLLPLAGQDIHKGAAFALKIQRLGLDANPGLRHLLVLSAMWVIWPAVIWGLK